MSTETNRPNRPNRSPRGTNPAAAALGRIKSEAKATAARRNAIGNPGRTGQPHSEETKAKLRAAWERRKARADGGKSSGRNQ